MEQELVHIALENLERHTGIKAGWKKNGPKDLDGLLEIKEGVNRLKFNVEIRRELRNHQLQDIINLAQRFTDLIIVANHIFPKIKEVLRQNHIAYLETNGNIWVHKDGVFIWMDAQKPLKAIRDKSHRAFTKTGLKVIFHFLLNEEAINLPYREIAAITEVGLGNINYVMTGLKEMGFLIKLNKKDNKLVRKRELLEKWVAAYAERLKPTLKLGNFRFLKEEDFRNWKRLPLNTKKTRWGGEPAGDLLTNYLRPAELTLYTDETRVDLIKKYRLVPDEKGYVKAYKKFWKLDEVNEAVVPPILVYTDLMNANDRRCAETAQKIYDELLQNQF